MNFYEEVSLLHCTNLFCARSKESWGRDIEQLCEKFWVHVCENLQWKWIMHRCQTKECCEGYATVDGVEKIRRPMCAAPKDNVEVPPNCPNVIQCCPNTPVLSGKNKKPSKFCAEHSNEVRDDGFIPRLEQFLNLPEIVRNGQIKENDDESVLVGCKKRKDIDRFYDRTAGALAAGLAESLQHSVRCSLVNLPVKFSFSFLTRLVKQRKILAD